MNKGGKDTFKEQEKADQNKVLQQLEEDAKSNSN